MAKPKKENYEQCVNNFLGIQGNGHLFSESYTKIEATKMKEEFQKSSFSGNKTPVSLAPLKMKNAREFHARMACPDNCTCCLRRLLIEMRNKDKKKEKNVTDVDSHETN